LKFSNQKLKFSNNKLKFSNQKLKFSNNKLKFLNKTRKIRLYQKYNLNKFEKTKFPTTNSEKIEISKKKFGKNEISK